MSQEDFESAVDDALDSLPESVVQDFESAVDDALDSLPESVVQELEAANVVILVEQEPDPDSYGHMVRHGELLGLYVGTPLDKRSTFAGFSLPDQIFVYRGHPGHGAARDRAPVRPVGAAAARARLGLIRAARLRALSPRRSRVPPRAR
jgi:predicted Zn-dependent protease with MMP-like domain